ncbi:GLPGLI family protein [Aquimarina megaterium]|uniref:GLPGLI family protein n=1 Tax=Aquimarina megaterium TaxID=1443666 RepID=UPI0009426ED8|nr:GLPGLI family protein [Aquimarina megaterium]
MNKYQLMYFLILMQISFVFAQEKVTGTVEYFMTITQPDGIAFANPYTLYFDNEISFFIRTGDAKRVDNKNDIVNINGSQVTHTMIKSNLPQPFYYTNIKKQELISREKVVRAMYLVEDVLEPIPWRLQQEHKKIGKYNCQKAKTKYRGREYTVWFASEIPISHGPWKLRGLPGLILEVTEETGKYGFIANVINLNPDTELLQEKLKKPDVRGITTLENYIEAIKNKYKETMARARASLPRGARLAMDCDVCPDPKNYSLERFD